MMKTLTSSVYTFSDLIQGDFLYVDKTEYIWKLLQPAKAMYFMSRPRRFGKSLTVSTLEAIFSGRKELFNGLALYDKKYDWKTYPIIHLDLNGWKADTPEVLNESLSDMLHGIAALHDVVLFGTNPPAQFRELIVALAAREKVVILVDEYDKPILGNATEPHVQQILDVLKEFYSIIKATEPYLRFVFVTGVTKFCHVSLFSELNNLTDITMNLDYAAMLGYTQQEFETNFQERITAAEAKQELDHAGYLEQIKNWYNGYKFHPKAESVYNPVSLASFFSNHGEFNNYWFSTGTPSFLFELMKQTNFNYCKDLNSAVSDAFFEPFELDQLDPLVLLFQTGYLTIDKMVQRQVPYTRHTVTEYLLRFPNWEVEDSFNNHLLAKYANVRKQASQRMMLDLVEAVGSCDVDSFMKILQGMFANIPYNIHIAHEHYYQTIFYVIYDMLRVFIEAEICTNDGRIDLMFAAGEWIYVIELKLNQSAEAAMTQIQNKDYAMKYRTRGKRIMQIGANFDSSTGQLTDWISEELVK